MGHTCFLICSGEVRGVSVLGFRVRVLRFDSMAQDSLAVQDLRFGFGV